MTSEKMKLKVPYTTGAFLLSTMAEPNLTFTGNIR